MKTFLKAAVIIFIALMVVIIVKSCVEKQQRKEKLEDDNTRIELIIEGPTHKDSVKDGEYVNGVVIAFKNTGYKTINKVSCDVLLYDEQGELIGEIEFDFNVSLNEKDEPIEPGEESYYYSKILTSEKIATSFKVENLKVNGISKDSGYN